MTEKTSEILNRAADEIQKYGWTIGSKGWYREEGVGLCVEGGILAAMGYQTADITHTPEFTEAFRSCPAYQAVQDYLDHSQALYEWNDGLANTGEHVIEVLRGAALVEAAKEQAALDANATDGQSAGAESPEAAELEAARA